MENCTFSALLNPRQFGLVTETPSNSATRSLIMVAKCLQNLANLVEFGGKVDNFQLMFCETIF